MSVTLCDCCIIFVQEICVLVEMAGLKFYYDLMSQPSRAVFLFLKATNIPFIAHKVALRKGVFAATGLQKLQPLHYNIVYQFQYCFFMFCHFS